MILFHPVLRLMSIFAVIVFWAGVEPAAAQEISVADRAKLNRVTKSVDSAGSLFKKGDFEASARSIKSATKIMIELAESGDAAIIEKLENDHGRIAKAQKMLAAKGQSFDELKSLDSYLKSDDSQPDTATASEADADTSEQVSFVHQVAPIVVEHCGRCHIDRSLGRYSAKTYDSLKKGSRNGPAVRPRDIEKSLMIALISNGEMPPEGKGTPVPDDKLQILKDWIEQGAKFDGDNREKKAPLTTYVSTDSDGGKVPGQTGSPRDRKGRGKITSLGGGEDVPKRGGGGG